MSKPYFTKCFACWSGYGKCGLFRIPRKNKKQFKKFLQITGRMLYRRIFDDVTSCDLSLSYKRHKPLFYLTNIVKKYSSAFDVINNFCNDDGEEIYIDNTGKLSWYWEDDNGLYSYDGLMPFCYSKEEAGRTWAFDEVENLISYHLDYPDDFQFPDNIKSDLDLLKFLNTKPLKPIY